MALKEKVDKYEEALLAIGFTIRMVAVRFNWIDGEMQKGKSFEVAANDAMNRMDTTYDPLECEGVGE